MYIVCVSRIYEYIFRLDLPCAAGLCVGELKAMANKHLDERDMLCKLDKLEIVYNELAFMLG